jgi:hypothetical protein
MHDTDRYKLLHGPYLAPRCWIGSRLFCEVRGEVIVCGITAGRIPWPIGKRGSARSPVVCGDLINAVRLESNLAVCHWWGVAPQTVSKWRKAIGVPMTNEGTRRLHVEYIQERLPPEVQERARAKANSPAANAKKALAKLGKPQPPHVLEALKRANTGRKLTAEHRAKIGEANRRIGRRPPAGRVWEPWELALLGTLPDAEVAKRTSRTELSVSRKRCKLRIEKADRHGRGLA